MPSFPSSSSPSSSSSNWCSLFGLPRSFGLFSLVRSSAIWDNRMMFSVSLCEWFLPWIYGIQKVVDCSFLPSEVKLCILHFHSIHSRFFTRLSFLRVIPKKLEMTGWLESCTGGRIVRYGQGLSGKGKDTQLSWSV